MTASRRSVLQIDTLVEQYHVMVQYDAIWCHLTPALLNDTSRTDLITVQCVLQIQVRCVFKETLLTIQSMQVEMCSEKDVIFTCTKRAFDENVSLASLGVILSSAEMFWEPFRNGLGVI